MIWYVLQSWWSLDEVGIYMGSRKFFFQMGPLTGPVKIAPLSPSLSLCVYICASWSKGHFCLKARIRGRFEREARTGDTQETSCNLLLLSIVTSHERIILFVRCEINVFQQFQIDWCCWLSSIRPPSGARHRQPLIKIWLFAFFFGFCNQRTASVSSMIEWMMEICITVMNHDKCSSLEFKAKPVTPATVPENYIIQVRFKYV